jgi:hypothetical protein
MIRAASAKMRNDSQTTMEIGTAQNANPSAQHSIGLPRKTDFKDQSGFTGTPDSNDSSA